MNRTGTKKTMKAPGSTGAFDCVGIGSEDTVAAIATPTGTGGISVVRISGGDALRIVDAFVRLRQRRSLARLKAWFVGLGVVVDPDSRGTIDEVIVLVMRGPRSYTGEDVVEIQCHGGRLVTEKILSLALRYGARAAAPGEFTRRAYLSGRISLIEAEAVLDVVNAPSEASLREASRRLKGELGQEVRRWEKEVLGALASMLAASDFPEDVEDQSTGAFCQIDKVRAEIRRVLVRAPLGLALASGIEVCLVGRPNAGKSSLFNALLGQERAIVTEVPGTTRDVLRERTEWEGLPVILLDTAGLRETSEVIEAIGVDRAREAAQSSEVILYVVDATVPLTEEDRSHLARWQDRRLLLVINKTDLGPALVDGEEIREVAPENRIPVSTVTGKGLSQVKGRVLSWFSVGHPEGALLGSARQIDCLRRAEEALTLVLNARSEGWTEDVVIVALESAAGAFAELTGRKVSEEALEQVFARFCVGK